MDALKMIATYQGQYSGLSSYIDNQLQVIRQALEEYAWRQNEDLPDWGMVNIATAEKLTEDLLRIVYVDGEAREYLIGLLSAISGQRSARGGE